MLESSSVQTVTLNGERFVIIRESDFLLLRGEAPEPDMPKPDANGNFPAAEAIRVSIARSILRERRALGLTQADLARRAGIRPETLNRIEQGKRAPSPATAEKIDRALKSANEGDR